MGIDGVNLVQDAMNQAVFRRFIEMIRMTAARQRPTSNAALVVFAQRFPVDSVASTLQRWAVEVDELCGQH